MFGTVVMISMLLLRLVVPVVLLILVGFMLSRWENSLSF